MNSVLTDLRLAFRGLRRNPLFAVIAILSLALGIGANTAIFTLIDQVLLRKLPVTAPDELVMLYQQGAHMRQQHGIADALVPHLPGLSEAGRAAGRGACRRLIASVGQHRQPDRAARGRDGLRQLLLDAWREAGARSRVQLAGRRSGLPGSPGRRAELRLLGAAASRATRRSSARRSSSTTTR